MTDKLLNRIAKNAKKPDSAKTASGSQSRRKGGKEQELLNQYNIIRDDIVKLRGDLQKGYDLARGYVEKKGIIKQLLRSR